MLFLSDLIVWPFRLMAEEKGALVAEFGHSSVGGGEESTCKNLSITLTVVTEQFST